jgi:hypothetical protein
MAAILYIALCAYSSGPIAVGTTNATPIKLYYVGKMSPFPLEVE